MPIHIDAVSGKPHISDNNSGQRVTLRPQGAQGKDGSNVLPTDTAIKNAMVDSASQTAIATDARINTLIPAASTAAQGKVELATTTETTTGTDTARAVTPAGVQAVLDTVVAPTYAVKGEATLALGASADARALQTFHAALGGRHTSPCRVLGLGHSFMEGEGATDNRWRWWERFQSVMRGRFPLYDGSTPVGRGFLPAFYASTTMVSPTVGGSGSTPTQVVTMGPGGRTLFLPQGRTVSYSVTGTSVKVGYTRGSGSGTMTVSLDGTPQTAINTVNAGGTIDGNWVTYTFGAGGAHTVLITATTGGIYLNGVVEQNGNEAKGFQFAEAGHTAFKVSDLLAVASTGGISALWNLFDSNPPHLVFIEFGINEWVSGGGLVSPTQFRTNIDTLVAYVRAVAPLASIVFIADYQDLGTYTYTWQQMVKVYYDKALTDAGITVCDLSKRMPVASTSTSGLGMVVSDGHPSDKGAMTMAEYIAGFVSPR